MSSSRWDDLDGVTPWRSAVPAPKGELFVRSSPDPSVADMLALSGAIPVAVHLYEPPAGQAPPYLVVEPLGATASMPACTVRVTLVTADDPAAEVRDLPWDPDDFSVRVRLGDAIRELAPRLTR